MILWKNDPAYLLNANNLHKSIGDVIDFSGGNYLTRKPASTNRLLIAAYTKFAINNAGTFKVFDIGAAAKELAEADRARAEADAEDPRLLALLGTIRQKRDQLTALAERVQTLSLSGDKGVFTRLDSKSACFRWQKPDQFYGDASEAMMSCAAFRIGSDGQNCWWHYEGAAGKKKLVLCPLAEIRTRNVSFCDPFGMTGRTPAAAAADLSLRLVTRDRQIDAVSHLFEAWEVHAPDRGSVWGQLTRWHVDAPRGRTAVIETFHPYGVIRTRFHYDSVNEPLPAAAFAVPKLEGLPPSPPEALDEDYTGRFINLRDGSDGRMSVRWGKQGPKGTSGGGLN